MKPSTMLIAVMATLPLAALAVDNSSSHAKTKPPVFSQLDTNRDGRLSKQEAARDPSINFATADKNGDGYVDGKEYTHRDPR
jgi:hypothetical protein